MKTEKTFHFPNWPCSIDPTITCLVTKQFPRYSRRSANTEGGFTCAAIIPIVFSPDVELFIKGVTYQYLWLFPRTGNTRNNYKLQG